MKAVRFHEYGGPEVLRLDEVPTPALESGQVLVRVVATSFNPADVAIRSGAFAAVLPIQLPHTLGLDVAGTIVSTSADVAEWSEGDAVIAFLPPQLPGAAAEYVVVPTSLLARAPERISLEDAASLPGAGTTASQALFEHGQLLSGQHVLVNGGGGVVGGMAVQLAARAGATVTAIAGPASVARVAGYGASGVIDRTEVEIDDLEGGKFDLVVNFAPTKGVDLARLVRTEGRLVNASSDNEGVPARIVAVRMAAHPDAADLTRLVEAVDAGDLIVNVVDRRPLTEAREVHVSRLVPGKTLLIP